MLRPTPPCSFWPVPNLPQRQPVTAVLMTVLHQSMDFNNPGGVVLWVACCLGLFGFLRAFGPALRLTMADVQVDSSSNPQSFQSIYQVFEDWPFAGGCFVFLGHGSFLLCPVVFLLGCLHLHGPGPGALFIYQNGTPLSGLVCLLLFKLPYNRQVSLGSSWAIVFFFESELQLLLPGRVFLTISLWLWGVGLLKLTSYMCVLHWKPSFLSQDVLSSSSTLHLDRSVWVPSDLGILFFGALPSSAMSPFFSEQCLCLLGGSSGLA